MPQFKNILVYLNPESDEQPALQHAVRLAQGNGAELHVLDVLEEPSQYAVLLTKKLHIEDRLEGLHRESEARLEALVAPFRAAGTTVNTHVTTGKPFLEIIRAVLRHNHDLVVKTVEPETGWKTVFFGSTDMHLLRNCPGTLWLLNPTALERYRHILVAVVPETEEHEQFALGSRLLRLGASLARAEGARLSVMHAWTAFAEKKFRFHLAPSQFAQYMRESRQETQHQLRTFLSKAGEPIPPACVHLVKGEASAVIPRFAKKHAVDLVVMGTVGRSGIPGLLIGNTAEKILTHLESSVLTLKPAAFVSPVSL